MMRKPATGFPLGKDAGPINVAVQRPTVNIREAENVGEQVAAQANKLKANPSPMTFAKHGTFYTNRETHPGLED